MLWELLDTTAEHRPFDAPSLVGVELGEEFKIITDEKAPVYRVKTLDTVLAVLEDELRADPQADVRMVLRGKVLYVTVISELGRPWGRNISRLIEELRLAITQFSMGEGWPPVIYGQQVSVSPRTARLGPNHRQPGNNPWI